MWHYVVMATLPVIANVYRVALVWYGGTLGTAVNVLHFRGTPGSAAGLYTAIDANADDDMWGCAPTGVNVTSVDITPLDGSTATVENGTGGGAKWSGKSGGQGIPQASYILKLRTAKRGLSYRGRIYLPWLSESLYEVGVVDAGQRVATTTAWTTFRTAVAAAGYTMVVASYKLSSAELVTTAAIEQYAGTQRRRQERLRSA